VDGVTIVPGQVPSMDDLFGKAFMASLAAMARRTAAVDAVTSYLNLNYPCKCDDDECPGNAYEAEDVVGIVIRKLEGL
jgi:hypothetical protein